jgi:hypothetical protein
VLPVVPIAHEKSHNEQVEDWREVVGNKLHGAPFTSDAYDFVMGTRAGTG